MCGIFNLARVAGIRWRSKFCNKLVGIHFQIYVYRYGLYPDFRILNFAEWRVSFGKSVYTRDSPQDWLDEQSNP